MAEVITDQIMRRRDRRDRRGQCRTGNFRLDGSPSGPWESFAASTIATLRMHYNLPAATAEHLVRRYGRRALDVASYLAGDPALAQPIVAGEPDVRAELRYQREHEMAIFPDDHLFRRTRLGLFHPELVTSGPAVEICRES